MTFRTSRKPALANLAERKEYRVALQRTSHVRWKTPTLAQWREAKAIATAQLAQEQAAIIRNRQQSAQAQSEQQ